MKFTSLIMLSIFLFSCNAKNDQAAPKEELISLVNKYYEAQASMDTANLRNFVADNFINFEDGEMSDKQNMLIAVTRLPDYEGRFNFENVNAHIDKEYASMYYTRIAEFTLNDSTSSQLNFLESATFLKQNGQWRIRFLHSTLKK